MSVGQRCEGVGASDADGRRFVAELGGGCSERAREPSFLGVALLAVAHQGNRGAGAGGDRACDSQPVLPLQDLGMEVPPFAALGPTGQPQYDGGRSE